MPAYTGTGAFLVQPVLPVQGPIRELVQAELAHRLEAV